MLLDDAVAKSCSKWQASRAGELEALGTHSDPKSRFVQLSRVSCQTGCYKACVLLVKAWTARSTWPTPGATFHLAPAPRECLGQGGNHHCSIASHVQWLMPIVTIGSAGVPNIIALHSNR